MERAVHGGARLEATVVPPGDKSVSHRAALLNAISDGRAKVTNFCVGDDRTSMLGCLRGLGVEIAESVEDGIETFTINGKGLDGLSEPLDYLYAGNSGTTMRLVSGLLAAQPFFSVITGDSSLRGRPMKRILTPLSMMGAQVMGRGGGSLAPLAFDGGGLHGIEYEMPVASAQLKSCILIAGLFAEGDTSVIQPAESRDHTERMMASMGADVEKDGLRLTVRRPSRPLASLDIQVPCDISGAAFWLVAGAAHPNARITVQGVGINPSRTGVLDVLDEMGANIRMENVREVGNEPSADLVVESSDLRGVEISGDIIPRVIDELPVLAGGRFPGKWADRHQGRRRTQGEGVRPDFLHRRGSGHAGREDSRDRRRHDDRGRLQVEWRGGRELWRPQDSDVHGGRRPDSRWLDHRRRIRGGRRFVPDLLGRTGRCASLKIRGAPIPRRNGGDACSFSPGRPALARTRF